MTPPCDRRTRQCGASKRCFIRAAGSRKQIIQDIESLTSKRTCGDSSRQSGRERPRQAIQRILLALLCRLYYRWEDSCSGRCAYQMLFEPSPPAMFPLSRTSAWLAPRSSIARWSREECSSASFVCKDLYKFTLELTCDMPANKARLLCVNLTDTQKVENNGN